MMLLRPMKKKIKAESRPNGFLKPGAGQKRTGSATMTKNYKITGIFYVEENSGVIQGFTSNETIL